MTKRAQWNSPRISLLMLLVMALAAIVTGCGGGGGGSSSNGNGGNGGGSGGNGSGGFPVGANVAAITGKVVDNIGTGNPVVGATISVVGTTLKAQTASDGTFALNNVPPTATAFTVTTPDASKYPNIVTYQSQYYNTDPGRAGGACTIALPSLTTGTITALPGSITMYNLTPAGSSGSTSPPPPPPVGCF